MADTDTSNETQWGRILLTISIGAFSILIIGLITWKSIGILDVDVAQIPGRVSAIQSLFSTILPLIGTWMGAVIAYYFGKENFDAANKSVQSMVQKMVTSEDKLKSIKVSDPNVMIALGNIYDNKDIRVKNDPNIMVEKDLLGFFDVNKNIERLPIMDSNFVVRYILHKSLITDFMLNISLNKLKIPVTGAPAAPAAPPVTAAAPANAVTAKTFDLVTLDDLINSSNDQYKQSVIKSAEFVSKDASLLEVQTKINNSKYCQDVFVTDDGSASKPVIGWITNNKVNELSKL